jgi:uncharacterized protein YjiS (DUF1127 family)
MNTVSIAERGFPATVPLLGSQGWVVPPAAVEPRTSIGTILRRWLLRSRTRQEISELDEHMLRDIGVTRFDVMVESRKHFWQP